MPKSKKRKTLHHHNPTQSKPTDEALSHAEIWDDSALIRSWNDALTEYEFYHSIHARGEDVDEVLRRAELEPTAKSPLQVDDAEIEDGEVDEREDGEVPSDPSREREVPPLPHEGRVDGAEVPKPTADLSSTADGHATKTDASSTAADQTLENVKMAYYWAGYYSGLYDGQRQAQAQAQAQVQIEAETTKE